MSFTIDYSDRQTRVARIWGIDLEATEVLHNEKGCPGAGHACEECRFRFCDRHICEVEPLIWMCRRCTLKRLADTAKALAGIDRDAAFEACQAAAMAAIGLNGLVSR